MNWRVLSVAVVVLATVVTWQMLPRLASAEEMKLPKGVTLKVLNKLGAQGMPGVKNITFNRVTIAPGAKWPNMVQPAKTWDFCYEFSGNMSVNVGGKVSVIKPGTSYTIPPNAKFDLLFNTGKVPAVDLFWEIELE